MLLGEPYDVIISCHVYYHKLPLFKTTNLLYRRSRGLKRKWISDVLDCVRNRYLPASSCAGIALLDNGHFGSCSWDSLTASRTNAEHICLTSFPFSSITAIFAVEVHLHVSGVDRNKRPFRTFLEIFFRSVSFIDPLFLSFFKRIRKEHDDELWQRKENFPLSFSLYIFSSLKSPLLSTPTPVVCCNMLDHTRFLLHTISMISVVALSLDYMQHYVSMEKHPLSPTRTTSVSLIY